MSEISAKLVKELREKTGAGMMDCKEALAAAGGDLTRAVEVLRKKGLATAQKRAGRATAEGTIAAYIHHGGKLGVLVEVDCETDFVAKNEQFQEFARNLAMHIAAANPLGVRPEDIAAEVIAKEREIYTAQAKETGKPDKVIEKIVEGKLKKFYEDNCLLQQRYVRNPDITIADLLNEMIAKIGENITIRRFVRMQVGE
ncbi:MAG: translation elongation factor Ts [Desulfobacterales bacterium]